MSKIFGKKLYRKEYLELVGKASELNSQVEDIASFGAMILAFLAFLTLCIICPFSIINVLIGVCVINIVFDNFFAEKYFGRKGKEIVDTYCVIFLMCTLPVQWFATGGFEGPGGMWIIFTAVYCIFGLGGRSQVNILCALAVEVVCIMVANITHPELVVDMLKSHKYVVGIVSILGVGAYIQYLQTFQTAEYLRDRIELEQLQEETNKHFATSVAINEDLLSTTLKLEQANKTQKSFNASMNHELRAPLNGIEGCLQILLMDENLSEESRETVLNALTASKTINQTVNDLLDFAMLDEGRFEMVKKTFDLRDILDNLSTIFRPQANAKNLKFTISIPKDTRVMLVADSVRIQQIMTNLISNGIKYTHEGSVTMTVTTERGLLKFDVADTGQGMSRESVDTLFDPFTRFNREENVNIQGSGLGMNIVYNLITAMNGTIDVRSRIGKGTTFHVEIPIIFYDSDILYSTPRESKVVDNRTIDLKGQRILYVDDTEINRTVFKGLLSKTGAEVTLVDSGKRAIRLCNEEVFDIIFMDHHMPELDGIETMKYIRNLKNTTYKQIPIVMCTGNAGAEYRKLYSESGANGYLLKPFMYGDLIECFELLQK